MANQSINEPIWVINQNKINEILLKSEVLLEMALCAELEQVPIYIIHDYFWILSDFIADAKKLT